MPQESRKITFPIDEFMAALMTYNKKRGGKSYTMADIAKVGVDQKNGGRTQLTMRDGLTLAFSEADVLAALISFCIDNGIPLPSNASKQLRISDEGISLNVVDWKKKTRIEPSMRGTGTAH